jgi:hypothetical protein
MYCESIVKELGGYGVLNAIGVEPVTEISGSIEGQLVCPPAGL